MTNPYCEKISELPQVPDQYLLTEDQIINLDRLSPDTWWAEGYGSFMANNELTDFIQPYFSKPIAVRYQLITKDRPFHIDTCAQTYKYNYVYKTGGSNVKTIWRKSIYPSTHLLDDDIVTTCDNRCWYKLNVKLSHCVIDIETARCSITVKEDLE